MAVPVQQFRTIEDATSAAGIMKARMQLLATAMADALAVAQSKQPGACERIAEILGPARESYLKYLRGQTP